MLAAVGLGVGLLAADHALGPTRAVFLFPGPATGARSFLAAIIQAMITFTGLVFSITIVVLQLTSGQFSPRVLRTFLRDRTVQLSLGVFLATFVYAMVVLRGVRGTATHADSVPRIAVTVCFLLVLCSVGLFIRYVAHIANMIRVASIIDSIGRGSRICLARRLDAEDPRAASAPVIAGPATAVVCAPRPGVVTAVDTDALVGLAHRGGCQLAMVPSVGDFVPEAGALLQVFGPGAIDERRAAGHISLDTERLLEDDLPFGFRQLVDIAQRALSPGVNDPTTAVQTIDVMHDLLRRLAACELGPRCCCDEDGVLRLAMPQLSFAGYLGLAVGQVWAYAADSVQVPQRLTLMLADLQTVALPAHHDAIAGWLERVAPTGRTDPTWNTTLRVPTPDAGAGGDA